MAKLTVDELKTELKSIGFTDEQLTGMTKPALEKLADGYMRQSDYDREMNAGKAELKKAQDDLTAANDRLNAEMAEWATIRQSEGQVTAAQQARLEKAESAVAVLRARVSSIATQAGLDPTKALEGLDAPVVKPDPPQPTFDASKFVSADDYHRATGQLADMAMTLPAVLDDLRDEHRELFNKRLDTSAIITELKSRAGTRGNQKSLDPRVIWEELHKVPERRTEVAKAQHDAEIKAAREEGYQAARSEVGIPGSSSMPGRHSPVFGEKPRDSAIKRPQPGQTAQAAASAFRSGKYRQGKTGAGAPTSQ